MGYRGERTITIPICIRKKETTFFFALCPQNTMNTITLRQHPMSFSVAPEELFVVGGLLVSNHSEEVSFDCISKGCNNIIRTTPSNRLRIEGLCDIGRGWKTNNPFFRFTSTQSITRSTTRKFRIFLHSRFRRRSLLFSDAWLWASTSRKTGRIARPR